MDEEYKKKLYEELIKEGLTDEEANEVIKRIIDAGYDLESFPQETADWFIDYYIEKVRATPAGPTIPAAITELKTWKELYSRFEKAGLPKGLASKLADDLSGIDYTGWTDEQIDKFLTDWANIALEQQALAKEEQFLTAVEQRYGTTDPKMLKMLAEQQAITAGGQIKERERAEAERRWYEETVPRAFGQPKTYAELAAPAEEGAREISPAFQRYFERELPSIYQELGMPEARKRAWAEKTKYLPEVGSPGGTELSLMTPEEQKEALEGEKEWERESERRRALRDPWEALLEQPSFMAGLESKFKGLTPAERGYRSGLYRPRTRFLSY